MNPFLTLANTVWRDYVTDGVAGSGPKSPVKNDIRNLFTYVVGANPSTGNVAIGGEPDLYQPADDISGLELICDNLSRCFSTTKFSSGGGAAPWHANSARGTQASPSMPLSGDNLLSIGGRSYDSTTETFAVSSVAIIAALTENARAGATYSGSSLSLETTQNGGGSSRQPALFILPSQNVNIGSVSEHGVALFAQNNGTSRAFAAASNGGALVMYTGGGGQTFSSGENTGDAAAYFRKDAGTNASIHAAGTIGASGSDYGDRETKSSTCAALTAGSAAGYDIDGLITDRWSKSVSFGIVSTDPSFIGGDIHFSASEIGEQPRDEGEPLPPRRVTHKCTTQTLRSSVQARGVSCKECDAHAAGIARWQDDHDTWEEDAKTLATRRSKWKARYDAVSAGTVVIAKAGKVPVTVDGAVTAGGYLVATSGEGDAIKVVCVASRPTGADAGRVIGRVLTSNPTPERIRKLINESIPINAGWTAIADVIRS